MPCCCTTALARRFPGVALEQSAKTLDLHKWYVCVLLAGLPSGLPKRIAPNVCGVVGAACAPERSAAIVVVHARGKLDDYVHLTYYSRENDFFGLRSRPRALIPRMTLPALPTTKSQAMTPLLLLLEAPSCGGSPDYRAAPAARLELLEVFEPPPSRSDIV